MKWISLISVATLLFPLVRAEEVLPVDVQRVSDQRDAAIEKINTTYIQELEKLKINYTKQGNLDAANKIVALISAVKAEGAKAEGNKKDGNKPDSLIGKWTSGWAVMEIKADGVAILSGAIRGSWVAKDSTLTIRWDNGFTDSYGLPAVDGVLSGKNQLGAALRFTKSK